MDGVKDNQQQKNQNNQDKEGAMKKEANVEADQKGQEKDLKKVSSFQIPLISFLPQTVPDSPKHQGRSSQDSEKSILLKDPHSILSPSSTSSSSTSPTSSTAGSSLHPQSNSTPDRPVNIRGSGGESDRKLGLQPDSPLSPRRTTLTLPPPSMKPMLVSKLRSSMNSFPTFTKKELATDSSSNVNTSPSTPDNAAGDSSSSSSVTSPGRGTSPRSPRRSSKGPLPKHMREERFQRAKSNSTSSLFITSTPTAPDIEEIYRCVAVALYYHIGWGMQQTKKVLLDIFDEIQHPISNEKDKVDLINMPSVETIYKFISIIFHTEKLPIECGILCLAYIERILETTKITMIASNWRRVVLAAVILASKVWEDQAVWNADFLAVFPSISVGDLNQLEKHVLQLLSFNVSVPASMYAKYYFELRDLSDLDEVLFPLKPLDKDSAKRLEEKSQGVEKSARRYQRSHSVEDLGVIAKSPPVILS